MSALTLGNGQAFSADQDPARQLITAASLSGGGQLTFSRAYAYDPVLPRLTEITDCALSGENRSFGYDALNRIGVDRSGSSSRKYCGGRCKKD
jgi:hypothetical protein